MCAVVEPGQKLYAWGWNRFGQLGLGSMDDANMPCKVDLPGPVAQVACGWRHTLAVLKDDSAWSWGRGTNGQLGHGDTEGALVPKRIAAIDAALGGELLMGAGGGGVQAAAYIPPAHRYALVPENSTKRQRLSDAQGVPDVAPR